LNFDWPAWYNSTPALKPERTCLRIGFDCYLNDIVAKAKCSEFARACQLMPRREVRNFLRIFAFFAPLREKQTGKAKSRFRAKPPGRRQVRVTSFAAQQVKMDTAVRGYLL
jgi:hypothetical protein